MKAPYMSEPTDVRQNDQLLDAGVGCRGLRIDDEQGEYRNHSTGSGAPWGRMVTSEKLVHLSQSRVCTKEKRRDTLIAQAQHYGWEVGYLDEVWWCRVSQPNMHSWSEKAEPLRLHELSVDKIDPDPKALACYGMLEASSGRMRLR